MISWKHKEYERNFNMTKAVETLTELVERIRRGLQGETSRRQTTEQRTPKFAILSEEVVKSRLLAVKERAAVSGRFAPQDLFFADEDVHLRQAVLNRALNDFVVETFEGQLRWMMRPSARGHVLRLLEPAQIKALLGQRLPETDKYGALLREVLKLQTKVSLKKRNPEELLQLRSIAEILQDAGLETPEPAEIDRLLNAGAFAREFLSIEKPFVGRTAERKKLARFLSQPPLISTWPRWKGMTVSGLGGAGKSALLTRFLHDVRREGAATIIVFDFDRPGIDAADTVWLRTEMARQVGLQYPDTAERLRDARRRTRLVQANAAARQSPRKSSSEARSIARSSDDLLHEIRDALATVNVENLPLLIVLDTLEVLATSESKKSLLSWIDTVADIFESTPLKVLFSGRLFDDSLADFQSRSEDEAIHLDALPAGAAKKLLEKCGVSAALANALVRSEWLPLRPLELRLLARLAVDKRISAASLKRDLRSQNRELSAGLIYRRILARLGKGVIGRLASPGLVLRFVTATLIREILVPALDLPSMTDAEARTILGELARHSWLVAREGDIVRHRRDLRRSTLRLMLDEEPKLAQDISRRATEYFGGRPGGDMAEAMYHRLLWVQKPDDGGTIELGDLKEAYTSISPDIDDLPAAGQALLRFASLKGVPASDVELLPSQHFLSAYHKTGQRLVRAREFGQAFRFLDRRDKVIGKPQQNDLKPLDSVAWEREAMFVTANWERLAIERREDGNGPSGVLPTRDFDDQAMAFFHDVILGQLSPEALRDQGRMVLRSLAFSLSDEKPSKANPEAVGFLLMGLLITNRSAADVRSLRPIFAPILELYDRAGDKICPPFLTRRLFLLKLHCGFLDRLNFTISPSFVPLRADRLFRLAKLNSLKSVKSLLTDLAATLTSQPGRKPLTTRNVLSAVDALYKYDSRWKEAVIQINVETDPDLLRGPDIEFRDVVRFCLLAEFTEDQGRRELADLIRAQIDVPLVDLEPFAFSEALALDAEHSLESPVEFVDRSWRLGALLIAAAEARPNSNRLQWVSKAYQMWDQAIAALRSSFSLRRLSTALSEKSTEEEAILGYFLRLLPQAHEPISRWFEQPSLRLLPQAAGAEVSLDVWTPGPVYVSLLGDGGVAGWRSRLFADAKEAQVYPLAGKNQNAVTFSAGSIRIDVAEYPADGRWRGYYLAQEDPAGCGEDERELFILRRAKNGQGTIPKARYTVGKLVQLILAGRVLDAWREAISDGEMDEAKLEVLVSMIYSQMEVMLGEASAEVVGSLSATSLAKPLSNDLKSLPRLLDSFKQVLREGMREQMEAAE